MRTSRSTLAVLAGLACMGILAWIPGCGGVQYAVVVNAAAARIEEAKAVGAEQLAPYEYYFAREHLEQAQIESSEASYSDAVELAREAEEYASKAIVLAQSARRTRP